MTQCFRLMVAALLSAFVSFSPAAAQGTDTILILDASGSMWGQVDGQTKISAAKKAVDSILSKWKQTDRLGLMAYGHRAKGECRDIELMVPVTAFDPERIRAAVNGISPKGKTPMADSLRAAAASLRSTENKANVVLVSDGIETCAPDPCAVAAELKKAGVGFTAHVIGFDVTDAAAKSQLQCIARATGGVYLDASNAAGLETALGKAVEATQGAKVRSEAPAKPVADPYTGKNFRGTARLAAGLDPISDGNVAWAFYASNGGEKGDPGATSYGAPLADTVEPGNYIVEVEYGQTATAVPVKVEKGKPTIVDVVLDAGYVTSEGSVQGGGELKEPTWQVLDGKGDVLVTDYQLVPRFVLKAGSYTLRLTRGSAIGAKAFTVAAGDSINVALAIDAAKLLVSAVYAPGGPKAEKGFTVEVRKPSAEEGKDGDWIATLYDPLSRFDLPSGAYDVVTSVGVAKRVTRVDLTSGRDTRLDVVLNAGVVGIKAAGSNAIEIFSAERDINNDRVPFGTYYDTDLNLAMNAGQYVVEATFGDTKVEKTFTITAGKRTDVTVQK